MMEEIDLMDLLSYFLEKSKIIIITVLVCLLCGLVYTGFIKDAMYKSDVSVVLVSKNSSMSQNDIIDMWLKQIETLKCIKNR